MTASKIDDQSNFIAVIWILGTPEAVRPDFL
jgi:hypothetical protein